MEFVGSLELLVFNLAPPRDDSSLEHYSRDKNDKICKSFDESLLPLFKKINLMDVRNSTSFKQHYEHI